MRQIRVALVTNALGPPVRGNGTTVHRWLGWLPDVDVHVTPVAPGFDLPPGRPPHVVHGYHAIHGGLHARRLAAERGLPLVVSLGGTDLHALKANAPRAAEVREVLRAATLVTGAFAAFGAYLAGALAHVPAYAVVPRGVYVPDTPAPAPDPSRLRVLLPAGIRPVKDVIGALRLAAALRDASVPIELTIAGPVLEPAYAQAFMAALETYASRGRVTWRKAVPRTDMPALYAEADVVWNTSLHEGGPNALLEGLAYGAAVLARDVDGNRDLLGTLDAPGRLFPWRNDLPDVDALAAWHESIRTETPGERERRVAEARSWLRTHHDSRAEVDALRRAYERALD